VQRGLDNGRLCRICCTGGTRYIKALKESARDRGATRVESCRGRLERQINFCRWELMRQGLRLEPVLQAISDFPTQQNVIERVRSDLVSRPERTPHRSQWLDAEQVCVRWC